MPIRIYNTLTRTKEEFQPVEDGKVRMYSCGPTVYDYIHVGNARPAIFFDLVRRYLTYRGYQVTYVVNVTDVDDKIIARAGEEGADSAEIARRFTECFFEDVDRLGVQRADVHPRATDLIPDMIRLVETLLEKGYAYQVANDVFFDISKFSDYGKLSRQDLSELQEGARVKVDDRLQSPLDFALWKGAKEGEPSWDSPWGKGRPGWHIECSTMSMKYLGDTLDIHTGGEDLIFPHHENEIAQSEAATGKPFTKYWMHNGWLVIEGRKMSKSLGNFVTVRDLLQQYGAETIRFFMLSAHYKKPLDLTETSMKESQAALTRVYTALEKMDRLAAGAPRRAADQGEPAGRSSGEVAELTNEMVEKFEAAMDDDFNTPRALGAVFEAVRQMNTILDSDQAGEVHEQELGNAAETIRNLGKILGLFEKQPAGASGKEEGLADKLVDLLIELRTNARQKKDWALADLIRDRLSELNIKLEDRPEGTVARGEEKF